MNKKIISIILATILFILTSSFTLAEGNSSANVEDTLVNVAVGKDISLTGGYELNNMYKEYLVDGDRYTYAEVHWDEIDPNVGYMIDLGKLYDIKEFKLYALHENLSGRDNIKIDVSADGNEWKNILTRGAEYGDEFSNTQLLSDVLTVPVSDVSYIRYIKLMASGYGVWYELEAYAAMPRIIDAGMLHRTICAEFSEEIKAQSVTNDTLKVFADDVEVAGCSYSVKGKKVYISLNSVSDDVQYKLIPTNGICSIYDDYMVVENDFYVPVLVEIAVEDFQINKTSNTATANISLKNNTDQDKDLAIILGYYSQDKRLIDSGLVIETLNSNSTDEYELQLVNDKTFEDKSVLRAFVWDVTGNIMAPVTDYKEMSGNLTELYVSPDGNDNNIGTLNAPFKTIERAVEEVRLHNNDMTDNITVYLRGGVYELKDTIKFTPQDSGTNGYEIVYKSYPGEEAIITGGVKVDNWVEGDGGIWYSDVSGIDSALVMSVDGVLAKRAQSEEWIDIDTLFPEARTEDTASGLTVADAKYAQYKNQSDIQLRFIRGWKSYLLNVNSITAEENSSKFLMRQPTFYFAEYESLNEQGYETHYYNIAANNNFKIENAFEELDVKGEFYYNNTDTEKRVYYIPRDGENLLTADVRIAKLDKLIEIDGDDNANKVKNIVFEALTFSDGAWSRASEYGFVSDQAQILVYDPDISTENPGYTLTPGNILVNRAENISFKNNVIRNMGAGGIYFYKGVDNSKIVGNAFYDIGDSAITVSSPDQVYNEKQYNGKNLAAGKTAKAGSITGEYYTPDRAFDSNTRTLWAPRLYGNSWIQVDLEESYEIDRIELDYRTDGGHQSFDGVIILASNNPDSDFTQLTTTETISDTGVVYAVSNSEKYRYVRFKHTIDTGYWVLPEARIINESMDYVSSTDICDNNLIKNNYITRVGRVSTSAPGMQLYYVQDTEISNNYIYEVPYSGIALGWGWSSYKDSDTCGNNSILNNKVERIMLESFDGGGIYICGQQYGNSSVSGNWIINSINGGGIYLDTYSSNNNITNNVIENTLESFSAPADSFNNKWSNNYTSSVMTTVSVDNGNEFEAPNEFIMGIYPENALSILQNAGLTSEYSHLVELAGENLYPLTADDYYNNMLHDEDNHHILPWYLKKIYNTSFVNTCEKWLDMVSYDHLNAKLKLWRVVNSIEDSDDRAVIFAQCETLRNAMYEFAQSVK